MAQLGLTTYRLNNNLKSTALLIAFPFLLLTLMGVIVFALGSLGNPEDLFGAFGVSPLLGTGDAGDLALSTVYAWWPVILGIAAAWVLIGYLFNDAIIHRATGAKPVTREQQPALYDQLENLCISRGLAMPRLYMIDSPAMNAYASGIDARSYAITVTTGCSRSSIRTRSRRSSPTN